MKILIVGAAGKTGRATVEQALAAGHEVTAFVRNAADLEIPNVRVVEGDATDGNDINQAVQDQDAVIDTIGGKTPYKETTMETSAAKAIVTAMLANGVHRLIAISMLGIGDSEANETVYARLLVATFLRGAKKDKSGMETEVASSKLDWIIVRPAILEDDPAKGHVHVFTADPEQKAHTITRADVAAFLLAQLSSDQYLHQSVTIANT